MCPCMIMKAGDYDRRGVERGATKGRGSESATRGARTVSLFLLMLLQWMNNSLSPVMFCMLTFYSHLISNLN